ncbi:MAG: glycosyl hydrolase family 18 protein [Ginsengibacter sp.]
MKTFTFCFLVNLVLIPNISSAQFKVVGYIHPSRTIDTAINTIAFGKLTHLNIAFVNPDSTDSLKIPFGFNALIKRAHANHVKVLASIGGGSHNPYYAVLLTNSKRKDFINTLINFLQNYHLDGLDVDLEGDAIDSTYEPLIVELSAVFKPLNLLLTSALATWNAEKISDVALSKFDFINVMSYDQTGPWQPDKPGPHSTIAKAEEDLDYWIRQRHVPKENINLGLPFYGYCFNTKYDESMAYAEIVSTFNGADQTDVVMPFGGGTIHYNGLPTILQKTSIAREKAGGVMMWQLLQDAKDGDSLLNEIYLLIKRRQ